MTSEPKFGSLQDELAAALPQNFHCRVRYVHSPSKPCEPLFSPPPGSGPEKTRLASHLLTVSTKPALETAGSSGILVLGIEVLVYYTKHLTTIFVSKADSTGYLRQQRPSPVRAITTAFLRWMTAKERHALPSRKLVISLFARSQSQYLFPGSAENENKHVLDDRQLIKWWARVLDPIFPKKDECESGVEDPEHEYSGYLTVPGYEGAEARSFLPPSNSQATGLRWKPGNPLAELATARGIAPDAPPRCLLPRFPDDPKARFMQDLDDDVGLTQDAPATLSPSKRKSGKWSSIRDLNRFWEAMEFRQECSSGRVVGFLWLVVQTKYPPDPKILDSTNTASQDSSVGAQSSDPVSQQEEVLSTSGSPRKRRRKPLSGPIIPRQPRLKGGSSSLTATGDLAGMVETSVGDGLVLSKEGYDKAMQTLLHLDFANMEAARQSTSKWISEVSAICGIQTDWSLDVSGTAKLESAAGRPVSNGTAQVNDLGAMIRKKPPTPRRFYNDTRVSIPSSDYRTHPKTRWGGHFMIGNGVLHHDLVNIPFFGRVYDTVVVAHPLSESDWFVDRRTRLGHILYLIDLLREIQSSSRGDAQATKDELRARQDSINVLRGIRRKIFGDAGIRAAQRGVTSGAACHRNQGLEGLNDILSPNATAEGYLEVPWYATEISAYS
ncbi:hypothetical protein LTR37_019475 [Vermiconidia calcicola]|uniref:Uncharacterized protein n=1 Tax=Vermiconidia calcicola TaxID=1690605 RepID=A0ACC3MF85_9PEZI|nr:hypothetical protein LTR37_019475 [Vermiconidia calcicola]